MNEITKYQIDHLYKTVKCNQIILVDNPIFEHETKQYHCFTRSIKPLKIQFSLDNNKCIIEDNIYFDLSEKCVLHNVQNKIDILFLYSQELSPIMQTDELQFSYKLRYAVKLV